MKEYFKNQCILELNAGNGQSFKGYILAALSPRSTRQVVYKQEECSIGTGADYRCLKGSKVLDPLFASQLRIVILSRTPVHGARGERLSIRWCIAGCKSAVLIFCKPEAGGWFISGLTIEDLGLFPSTKLILRRMIYTLTGIQNPWNSLFRAVSINRPDGSGAQIGYCRKLTASRILLVHNREICLFGKMFCFSIPQENVIERCVILESSYQICDDFILSTATIVKLDVLELSPYRV